MVFNKYSPFVHLSRKFFMPSYMVSISVTSPDGPQIHAGWTVVSISRSSRPHRGETGSQRLEGKVKNKAKLELCL